MHSSFTAHQTQAKDLQLWDNTIICMIKISINMNEQRTSTFQGEALAGD